MKTVVDKVIRIPALEQYNYRGTDGTNFTVSGPGEVRITGVEFGERRLAAAQRRARGYGTKGNRDEGGGRRNFLVAGRRSGDKEAHRERRIATAPRRARGNRLEYPFRRNLGKNAHGRRFNDPAAHQERRNSRQQPGKSSRNNPLGQWYGRRRGDERRDSRRRFSLVFRRRKTDERRQRWAYQEYAANPDPRIRALERRNTFRLNISITGGANAADPFGRSA